MAFDLTELVAAITSIGALGMAAFALVDATKAAGGGISRVGLSTLHAVAQRFAPALERALGKDTSGEGEWRNVICAHWVNGRPRDEQKAIVRSLVRLGLDRETAPKLAPHVQVAEKDLLAIAEKLPAGGELTDAELNVLGRMDASIDAQLDAAFDRADQQYRNACQVFAGVLAVGLAQLAAYALSDELGGFSPLKALLVGFLAVPLAPIAKDLASSLQAAASALRATRR